MERLSSIQIAIENDQIISKQNFQEIYEKSPNEIFKNVDGIKGAEVSFGIKKNSAKQCGKQNDSEEIDINQMTIM